jgi:L-alanine-DL-glutamate epimerase-like enolase superfamily enzyme
VSLYDAVRDLPLRVDGYALEPLALDTGAWVRKTTVIHLQGGGETGLGEDVTYGTPEQDALIAQGAVLPLAGDWTLDSFSQHLATLELFDAEPSQHAYLDYRRWAFESAALDLALRQAGRSLAQVVGREPRPLTFVTSGGLGEPPTTARIRLWLDLYPWLRFKLDAKPSWTDEILAELAERGCVESIDLKGQYSGTTVDTPAEPAFYRRVIEALPEAWIEDPALTDETLPLLEPLHDRITWDAPIHSVADIEELRWKPRTVNIKPSRFGSVERLFAAYDHCEAMGIAAYGGGQWELGVGRGHIQLLAAIFHPDTPNDVAPGAYNADPAPGLPESPLAVRGTPTGFRAA